MQLSKPFDMQGLLGDLKEAGLQDAEASLKLLVTTVILWILGSFAFLVGSGQPLWGIASTLFQTAIPFISAELEKLTDQAPGSFVISGNPMALSKAFDLKALLDSLKAQGLPLLVKDVEDVIGAVFQWIEDSLKLMAVQTPLLAVAEPILALIPPFLDKELEAMLHAPADIPPAG